MFEGQLEKSFEVSVGEPAGSPATAMGIANDAS